MKEHLSPETVEKYGPPGQKPTETDSGEQDQDQQSKTGATGVIKAATSDEGSKTDMWIFQVLCPCSPWIIFYYQLAILGKVILTIQNKVVGTELHANYIYSVPDPAMELECET